MRKRAAAAFGSLLIAFFCSVPAYAGMQKETVSNLVPQETLKEEQDSTVLPQDAAAFEAMLREINEKNAQLDASDVNLDLYRYPFAHGKELFSGEDVALIKSFDPKHPVVKKVLATDEARAEVQWMFRLLRTRYGPYEWFGGDDTFGEAEKNILQDLSKSKEISVADYEKLLAVQLSFLEDSHFVIGNRSLAPREMLYANEQIRFYKRDGIFYKDVDCTRAVLAVNGRDPEDYIRRAIGQDGEITYYIYAMAHPGKHFKVTVEYPDGSQTLLLHPAKYTTGQAADDTFWYTVEGGVPYLKLNRMVFRGDKNRDAFLQSAVAIKSYPAAVIDIRSNPGGDGELTVEWFKGFTGQDLRPNYSGLRVAPDAQWLQKVHNTTQEAWDALMRPFGMVKDGAYYVSRPEGQYLTNDGPVLFLLTSRQTASSADAFTDALKNIENVVTIGTNTGGVLLNGANYTVAMPYSGMRLQFGECLFYWDKAYFREGIGIEPDLYLTGERLDERMKRFFERYLPAVVQKEAAAVSDSAPQQEAAQTVKTVQAAKAVQSA